jgi:hypothetical protein
MLRRINLNDFQTSYEKIWPSITQVYTVFTNGNGLRIFYSFKITLACGHFQNSLDFTKFILFDYYLILMKHKAISKFANKYLPPIRMTLLRATSGSKEANSYTFQFIAVLKYLYLWISQVINLIQEENMRSIYIWKVIWQLNFDKWLIIAIHNILKFQILIILFLVILSLIFLNGICS